MKEFGFREVRDAQRPPYEEQPPLQPAPIAPQGSAADPRLALTVCVSGMIASVEVPTSHTHCLSNQLQANDLIFHSAETIRVENYQAGVGT